MLNTEPNAKPKKDTPPVQVESLSKSFGNQMVLKGINLEVAEGETLSVLGRSGTGKSVLLKLIIGLHTPDSGSIRVNGEEMTKLPLKELNEVRKKVGFLFQQAALYDSLTIEENIAFPLRRHSKMSDDERGKRVRELLASVGMDQDAHKLPAELSGGMQKRVGLARALALEPDILLFDEPTAGLDPITAAEIDDLILRLQKERRMTSVVVTHDIQSARAVSDRLALMRDGQVLIEGTYEELKKSRDPFVMQFLHGS
jgi:phospholipid/cholesterol/gamma-HCH transport system ATP-binding protein